MGMPTPNDWLAEANLHPVHHEPVRRLMQAQQAILDELQQDRLNTPTGLVHHYTKRDGLEKITEFGTLWLSDYTKMIDTKEIAYGFEGAMDVFRQEYEDSARTWRLRRFRDLIESIAKKGLGTYFKGYVLSLSKHEDDLPQWREYGDSERGFCLSFDGPTLDEAFLEFASPKGPVSCGSFDVIYDDVRLRSLVRKYVRNALETVLWLDERPSTYESTATAMYEIGANLMFAFIFTALFFKSPGYVSEGEYRYFVGTFPNIRIPGLMKRGTGRRKVGYFAMDWKSGHADALKRVWIGPGMDEQRGRKIVANALRKAGLSVADIRMSVTPRTRR